MKRNFQILRGEILDVSIPEFKHPDKKKQNQRSILKSQSILKVMVLGRDKEGYYIVAQCRAKHKYNAVKITVGNQRMYVYPRPLFRIDIGVLVSRKDAQIKNRDQALHLMGIKLKEIEDTQEQLSGVMLLPDDVERLRILEDDILLEPIHYNRRNATCPVCRQLLPTKERLVSISNHQVWMYVGLCLKCHKYYSHDSSLMRKEGEIRGIPVAWSDLRYHSRVDGKVQYRTIYHPSSSNKSSEERNMVENNKVTANPNVESKEAVHFSSPEFGVALTQLPIIGIHDKRCPICNREPDGMSRIEYMVYDNEENAIKRFGHARHCSNCDVVFLDASYAKAITNQDSNYRVFTLDASRYKTAEALLSAATEKPSLHKIAPSIVKLPFAFSEKEIPNLSSESKVVSVYARKCHCKRCRDKYGVETIRNRTAVISTVAGDVVEVNVMFCAGCGRYFMNYTSFQLYRRTHGGLLLEYRFTGELAENNSAEYNFAPDSILSRCGYTVQHGVSEAYRRAVLRYILDSGKATKREIIELITGFIDLREYNPMYDGACARWRSDIFYVNQYRIQEQKKVYGLSFKQGR